MLPSLSGAKLEVLVPAGSEPANVSARRNALVGLKKIDSIRVSSSGKGGKTRYAVEVVVDSPPASTCPGLSTTATGPVVRTERELSDFKDVANELHHIVESAHSGQRCELCSAILNWFVFGENPDGVMLMFVSNERVARKLTTFLEDLLATTTKHASDDIQGCCSSQTLIPLAVHMFLSNPPATCDAA
ncbi:hypothetical protein PHYPSEUDO_003702 [Phytophthora pseudosyringae]|uniref:Uncharacterized protein n=1 Tax=Phytophthora pseudosyringae TaxID=221518 RepID=A0A8T1VR02_9STRA|nr:hypothetical protein PHYPSEUDO_003702 [Phytophthora pseudosyringae]